MKIHSIINYLETLAPLSLQEDYDNSGLLIGDQNRDIKKALIALDITEDILAEAIDNNCELIISHHPLIFKAIKKLTGKTLVERIVIKAIQNNIAIYAIHTNLDNTHTGVNAMLGEKLGLIDLKILSPISSGMKKLVTFCPLDNAEKVRKAIFAAGAGHIGKYDCCSYNVSGEGSFRALEGANPFVGKPGKIHFEKEIRIETILPSYLVNQVVAAMVAAHPYEEVAYDIYPLENQNANTGAGMLGMLKKEMTAKNFLLKVKKLLGSPAIRHNYLIDRPVKKIAICGGSGSFLISEAHRAGADIYLTGDLKYHDFFEYKNEMTLADAGHFETEQFTKELLYSILNKKFPTFALQISKINSNPISFL
ncbi:MAG TPA: Nif3-like dinuclear metal center hexameric protein [Bacteroidales bacterium]